MNFISEILKRRVPQIFGSYIVASSSLVLFIDWLVGKYEFPEFYVSLTLISVISIIPSVIILSYFHGAPGKDQWTKVEKIGVPANILFIAFIFLFGHYTNWWGSISEDEQYRNFYLHFTSSEKYIDHYYKDYGFGSHHFYDKEKFEIESITDSLLKEIRSKVFSKTSSTFSNHDLTIDASFYENEQKILDEFLFIKISKANEEELEKLRISTDKFSQVLRKRIDYYNDKGLPDVLDRNFIYKVKDLEKNDEYLILDRGATWGDPLKEARGNISWSVDQDTYEINIIGVDKLVKRIHEMTSVVINNLTYGDFRVGKVIEILDDDMVKIKMKRPGILKNKMRISSHRTYHWVKGGAEDRIEDITQLLESIDKKDLRGVWEHYSSSGPFDEKKAKIRRDEGIKYLNFEIQTIKEKMENNAYDERTTSDMDDMSYFMEVIETIDSIAIARITGSKTPVYRVRIGDDVKIDN